MGILIIDDEAEARIKWIVSDARKYPVPLYVVKDIGIPPDNVKTLTYEQIKNGRGGVPASHGIVLGNYRVAFSFEQQPTGLVRHLSVSVDTAGDVPHPIVIGEVAKCFGFCEYPPRNGKVWTEEYRPGEYAINVIELVKEDVQSKPEKSAVA